MFKQWKLGTVNIRSGKEKDDGAKLYSIAKELAANDVTICCLQEVRYRKHGHRIIELDTGEKYEFFWCGMQKKREAGVGLLIRKSDDIDISEPDIKNPRILALNLVVHGFNVRLVNGYSPTNCNPSENKKDEFYNQLRKACTKKKKNQKLIVAGDFNAKTELAMKKCCYDGTSIVDDEDCNGNGTRLKNFCRKHKLCISSTFFAHSPENRYTWYSPDGRTTRVNDYILAEKYVQDYITDCKAEPDIDVDSDHRLLIASMYTPSTKKARRKPKRITAIAKPDLTALHVERTEKAFQRSVLEFLQTNNCENNSSCEASDKIIKSLTLAGTAALPKMLRKSTVHEIWKLDTEFNALLNQRKQHKFGTPQYKMLTKSIKKRIVRLRNEKLKREADEINEHASRRKVEELYRCIKSDITTFKKKSPGNLKCDPKELTKHFKEHFNQNNEQEEPIELNDVPDYIKQLQNIDMNELNSAAPKIEEIKSTIKSLKNCKSASDIPAAYIKCAIKCDEFSAEMEKLYATIWTTNKIPKSWRHSKLIAIWKGSSKGAADDPTAYRGLQIGSTLCKILVVIIINRLKCWYEKQLMEEQQGFRSGRGTTDGIYIVKRVQQIAKKIKRPVFALFVDLSSAFDHINRKFMFKTLTNRMPLGTDLKLIKLLQTLYEVTSTSLAETPDNIFTCNLGVRQGGPESPILYNLFMDFVLRVYFSKCSKSGIKFLNLKYNIPASASANNRNSVGFHEIKWVGYADDLVLMFDNERSLNDALKLLQSTFDEYGLSINISKTKTMILNFQGLENDYPSTISSINDVALDNVKVFKYLGSNIKYNEENTGDSELEFRIDTAQAKLYELGKKMFNYRIHLPTRIKLLNALVRSRLVYSCQTWSVTQTQLSHMNAAYMGMIRKMVRGGHRRVPDTYRYVLSNTQLLRICNTDDVCQFLARQQRSFTAHIVRSANDRLLKRLLFNANESRQPGPRTTLYKMVITREGVTGDEFNKNALLRKY